MTPGTPTPEGVEEEPLFPSDAGASTQNMSAVADDGSTQSINRVDDDFGGRPMFRDDSRARSGGSTTAEIDLSEMDNDDYGRRASPFSSMSGMLLVAGFVALLVVGGGGAFLIATSSEDSQAGLASGDAPDTPADLETGDVFPDSVDVAGQPYTLSTTDDTDECATAAHGQYGDVLAENNCRQLVRATYINEDTSGAVTVGIASMGSPEEAQTAEQAQDLGAAQWFAGLQGEDGSGAERMDVAGGHGSGARWGPYLTFSLSAGSDGRVNESRGEEMAEVSEGFLDVPMNSLGENA